MDNVPPGVEGTLVRPEKELTASEIEYPPPEFASLTSGQLHLPTRIPLISRRVEPTQGHVSNHLCQPTCANFLKSLALILRALPEFRRVPLPESLLHDDSASESDGEDDHVKRSRVSAGSFKHSDGAKSGGNLDNSRSRASSVEDDGDDNGSVTGRSSAGPRVVDRLRRTRAAAAAIGKK